ncbi:hypothetical protein NPIL_430391 [Nephila pilipes]|uniref:Uncharacterized protein n=1 Tax=Nephila pilipes TaxID=299642 RepID=A0A8X6MFQ3_NEPPI|nr:hypothetical protein NPIL_430391 [Nephila pilipes]
MAKSETSAQRVNGNPDFEKDSTAALARSDLHCSKFFIGPLVHETFLRSYFFAPLNRSCRGIGQEPSVMMKYSAWSSPITDLASLILRPYC